MANQGDLIGRSTRVGLHKPVRREGEQGLATRAAIIGAAAALLGGAIGGVSSYMAADQQQKTTVNEARIERQKATYDDFLGSMIDLDEIEYKIVKGIQSGNYRDYNTFNSDYDAYNAALHKFSQKNEVAMLVESDQAESAQASLIDKEHKLQDLIVAVRDSFIGVPNDANKRTSELQADYDATETSRESYVAVARKDVAQN